MQLASVPKLLTCSVAALPEPQPDALWALFLSDRRRLRTTLPSHGMTMILSEPLNTLFVTLLGAYLAKDHENLVVKVEQKEGACAVCCW